jgi:hypothetical protein
VGSLLLCAWKNAVFPRFASLVLAGCFVGIRYLLKSIVLQCFHNIEKNKAGAL